MNLEIQLIGNYIVDNVTYTDPKLIPLINQPILAWVWGETKHITVPLLIETEGAKKAFNLDNIIIDSVNFNPENNQDMMILLNRIINRMNDFKVQE